MPKIAVLVPCYKRPEYTKLCLAALESAQDYKDTTFHLYDDGSLDKTDQLLELASLPKETHISTTNNGLRSVLLDFIVTQSKGADIITVVGNDCLMPKNWLDKLVYKLTTTDADIISPNVMPSNAAFKWGRDDKKGLGYRPAMTVGGLWMMRRDFIEDMYFEQVGTRGIIGAFQVLKQIISEKSPKVGWIEEVTVEDIGHWSGLHKQHIKSMEHKKYSAEIGRPIAW